MTGGSYRIRRTALNDLDAIGAFIQRDNPARAESFIDEIIAAICAIGDRPKGFPLRDDLYPGLRSCLHGKYLILFLFDDHVGEVVRIVHGARDLGDLF